MWFWCLVWVVVLLTLGYAVFSMIRGNEPRDPMEILGASIGLGAGSLGFLYFFASLAGLVPSPWLMILFCLMVSVVFIVLVRLRRLVTARPLFPNSRLTRHDWLTLLAGLALMGASVIVTIHALVFPIYEWDAFAIWALKAKVLAARPVRECTDYFQDATLSYSHQDYPLLVPFLMAGVYGAIGEINESAGRIIFPIIYIGFVTLLFGGLRRLLPLRHAAILTAATACVPALLRWSGAGIADPALSLFQLGAVLYLTAWLDRFHTQDIFLAGAFSAAAAFTKNEGLALLILNAFIAIVFSIHGADRRRWLTLAWVAAGAAILVLPWFIYRQRLPKTHENYVGHLTIDTISTNAPRLSLILPAILRQFTDLKQWGPLWLLLPLAASHTSNAFARRSTAAGWSLLLLHLMLYVIIYLITPWDPVMQMNASLDRLLLHILPTVVILISLHMTPNACAASTTPPAPTA